MTKNHSGDALRWTRAGLVTGARLAVPAMPVMALFSMAFGAYAAQKGLALSVATLMSTLMFAGASQFVVADVWSLPMTGAMIFGLAFIAATVNLRFFLIGASLQPWLGRLPPWKIYPALVVLTEPGWLLALRYRQEGGSDTAIVLGSGFVLWLVWIAGTMAGFLLGAAVANPQRYGLDVIMPVFFTVLLVPMWRGARAAVPWAVAGGAALLAAWYLPGAWYIIVGTVAGMIAAGLQHERA